MKKIRVVIAGGRFAGLSAAMHLDKTLARCGAVEFTLISRENFILFTPMLAHGATRFTPGSHRGQEHRSGHSGPSADALHFFNNRTTGNDRAPLRRSVGIRNKVLRFHCLVSLEGRVSDEAAAFDKEAAGHGQLDTRPILRQGIEQMITLRDVEAVSELAGRVRARAAEQTLVTSTPVPEAANHIQA